MTRLARRIRSLRHRLLYWFDQQTTEILGALAFGCLMFLMGCGWYTEVLTR